jgi:hypothetical protein
LQGGNRQGRFGAALGLNIVAECNNVLKIAADCCFIHAKLRGNKPWPALCTDAANFCGLPLQHQRNTQST